MVAAPHRFVFSGLLFLLFLCLTAMAQEDAAPEEDEQDAATEVELDVPEDSLSGSLDDSVGSIESARGSQTQLIEQGWRVSGDLRVGYIREETDLRAGTSETEESLRGRFRLGGSYNLNEWLTANARLVELPPIVG